MMKQKDLSIFMRTILMSVFMLLCGVSAMADDDTSSSTDVSKTITLEQAGKLSSYISSDDETKITHLKVSGPINSDDIDICAKMSRNYALSVLDLSEATATKEDLIGMHCFNKAVKLTRVSLPQGITSIGNYAFQECESLTSIIIPETVKSFGCNAFWLCTSLPSITIPDGVTVIPSCLFKSCKALTSFKIPDSVTGIGDEAFRGCYQLGSITIPDKVTGIGKTAFQSCYKLAYASISESVTSIGDEAFKNCSDLVSVNIPSGITTLNKSVFEGCYHLTSITIPDGVTTIGNSAFKDCTHLASVNIPDAVETIGENAFKNCRALFTIELSDALTTLGTTAFADCTNLRKVTLRSNALPTNCAEDVFNNVTLSNATLCCAPKLKTTCTSTAPWSGFGTYDISTVTLIGDKRLADYLSDDDKTSLTSLKVLGKLASADISVLAEMSKESGALTTIDLSGATVASTNVIGDQAFNSCKKLTTIRLPQGITSIGSKAFCYCDALSSIIFPEGVTSLGTSAFDQCTSLTAIDLPESLTTLGNGVFSRSGLVSITIPDNVTNLENSTFSSCESLTSVTLGNKLTRIGSYAFMYCSNLTTVNIPETVSQIGSQAFYVCKNLSSPITIPDGVKKIGDETFRECKALTSVTIGKNVTSIGSSAFSSCTSLSSIVIPDAVTSIGKSAFQSCTSLNSVTISAKISKIDQYAFYECSSLNTVTLRCDALPTCGEKAFKKSYYYDTYPSTLYCKGAVLAECRKTAPWSSFGSIKPTDYRITLSSAEIATNCAPYDIDFTDASGIKAYIAVGFNPDDGKVLLTSISHVPAGTGFLVKGTEGTYDITAASTMYTYANLLVGVTEETSLPATDGSYSNYVLANGDNGVGFYAPADNYTLAANKAYLHVLTSVSGAKSVIGLTFDDEGDTTGFIPVQDLTKHTSTDSSSAVYNLQGQRLRGFAKGLNIVRGRKIFIK